MRQLAKHRAGRGLLAMPISQSIPDQSRQDFRLRSFFRGRDALYLCAFFGR
jgi:hypothetical protein